MRPEGHSNSQLQRTAAPAEAKPVSYERLAQLPLLASTHFCMEVLLRGTVLDLRSASEVLTFDPCAVLRIFALIGEEYPGSDDQAQHLDECIITLGKNGLARALFYANSTWEEQARLNAFAKHAVTIARCAQIAAATLGLCEETAYLTGLLHDISALPAALGWDSPPHAPEDKLQTATTIANIYQLPQTLRRSLIATLAEGDSSLWSVLIEAAHQLADGNDAAMPQIS